ncbi:hypothetical protein R1sor_015599 [Riccia sorocarpa]|uniref:Cytoplasmic tRNA 2-thiolation protein 1 n=1 Tax=Riccia sorocarpa TaxID=122646 RepID=A0ABD3HG17_9MARC
MGRLCEICQQSRPALRRPKTGQQVCRECFFKAFEHEIHETIVNNRLFKKGDRVAVAASGGKDSTVLAHIMTLLNERHCYGLDLFLLSIDEGITGYRDDSLETVKRNEVQYGIPLKVLSYKTLYGWTMDDIVREIGRKNNCTFCGVFRRQALDRGAFMMKADKMATGHNADDIAETVLLNLLRGDIARPRAILDIIKSGEDFRIASTAKMPEQGVCKRCGYISSQEFCKACVLLEGLNRGLPRLGISRTRGSGKKAPVVIKEEGEKAETDKVTERISSISVEF